MESINLFSCLSDAMLEGDRREDHDDISLSPSPRIPFVLKKPLENTTAPLNVVQASHVVQLDGNSASNVMKSGDIQSPCKPTESARIHEDITVYASKEGNGCQLYGMFYSQMN